MVTQGGLREGLIQEWQQTEQVAGQFNDLLMRIRTFGLPLIATTIATGGALVEKVAGPGFNVHWLIISVPAGIVGLLLVAFELYLWSAQSWFAQGAMFRWITRDLQTDTRPNDSREVVAILTPGIRSWIVRALKDQNLDPRIALRWPEYGMWLLSALSLIVWASLIYANRHTSFHYSGPIFVFGAFVLFTIYLLDRFYYSSLLIGAVKRAEELESESLGELNLSHRISTAAPGWTYTFLPSLLYLFPILLLINIGMALMPSGPLLHR